MKFDLDIRTPFAVTLLSIASIPNKDFPPIVDVWGWNINVMQFTSFLAGMVVIFLKIYESRLGIKLRKKDLEKKEIEAKEAAEKKKVKKVIR